MTSGTFDISWQIDPFIAGITGFQDFSWLLGSTDETIDLVLDGAPTGLVGTLTVQITTEDGSVTVYFPSAEHIVETPPGTGRYVATVPRPGVGRYFVIWSDGITSTAVPLLVLLDSPVFTPLQATAPSSYRIKAGDLEPSLLLVLRNAGGDPIDLSDALGVDVTVQRKGDLLPAAQRPGALLEPLDAGQVVLDWVDGETDLPGVYMAEASILWPTNGRSTAPSKASYRFVIEDPAL